MALKKSEKRLLGLLGIVAFVFVIDQFVCSSEDKKEQQKKSTKRIVPTKVVNVVASKLGASSDNIQVPKPVSNKKHFDTWGRDPFSISSNVNESSRSSKKNRKKPKAVLNGIFWKQGKAYVLINNDIFSEGEEKGGIRVDRIEEGRVYCTSNGLSFTLLWRDSP